MSDRELLEAAAKAAGILIVTWSNAQAGGFLSPDFAPERRALFWNPLTDDGDALRLATQIGPVEFALSAYGTAVRKKGGRWHGCEHHLHGGSQSATRRAIVLCAAEIGADTPAQGVVR